MLGIKIMGSGAGGGFPQWNCSCSNCSRCREDHFQGPQRSQSSIAVTQNGEDWVLVNASPDLRYQVLMNSEFHPKDGGRESPIKAVVLVDAQIDHTTGLIFMREGNRIPLYCTDAVAEDLSTGYPILPLLSHYCGVELHTIPADAEQRFQISGFNQLEWMAVPMVGKAPPYSPHRQDPIPGDNIGLFIWDRGSKRSLFYAPALEKVPTSILPLIQAVDLILVDGTFWTEDEMIQLGFSQKRAADMGHMPVSGDDGILAFLSQFSKPRKILIHINNTNPILDESSKEYAQVRAMGVELAQDGMRINLE